jgi:hypothetical protein
MLNSCNISRNTTKVPMRHTSSFSTFVLLLARRPSCPKRKHRKPGVLKAVGACADPLPNFFDAVRVHGDIAAGGVRCLHDCLQLLERHLVLINHLD